MSFIQHGSTICTPYENPNAPHTFRSQCCGHKYLVNYSFMKDIDQIGLDNQVHPNLVASPSHFNDIAVGL